MKTIPPFGSQAFTNLYIDTAEAMGDAVRNGRCSEYERAFKLMIQLLPRIPHRRWHNFRRHLPWMP